MASSFYLGTRVLIQLDTVDVGQTGKLSIHLPRDANGNDLYGVVVEFPALTSAGYQSTTAMAASEGTASDAEARGGFRPVVRLIVARIGLGETVEVAKTGGGFGPPTSALGWSVYVLNSGPTLGLVRLTGFPQSSESGICMNL